VYPDGKVSLNLPEQENPLQAAGRFLNYIAGQGDSPLS